MKVGQIARLCHELNRAYCEELGDRSQKAWHESPQWQRDSALNGVRARLENPHLPTSTSHEVWLEEKRQAGWKYGPVKDPERKEHPCYVPYEELPEDQKAKDALFCGVVDALRGLVE